MGKVVGLTKSLIDKRKKEAAAKAKAGKAAAKGEAEKLENKEA